MKAQRKTAGPQLSIFDRPLRPAAPPPPPPRIPPKTIEPVSPETLDARFRLFHAENPNVYHELLKLARQALARGRTKASIKMLFEVVRWERYLETNDPDFKLNNNFHSRYARLLMEQEPDLRGLFELRELRS